jgi:8-oxo-dGTP pyrophosphatase MutT (NUDIX family)
LIRSTLIAWFDMAFLGPGNYVVVVLPVGGFKDVDNKLVLQCEPHTGKTWFHAGPIIPDKEHVDAAVRELFEEIDLTLTVDDLIIFQVPLPSRKHQLVYVFSAYIRVPYVTTNLRTLAS